MNKGRVPKYMKKPEAGLPLCYIFQSVIVTVIQTSSVESSQRESSEVHGDLMVNPDKENSKQ
jgi:hypothetical protein